MKVCVLGTGCTWFVRNNTSYLIDDKIVLDLPNGSYKNLISHVSQFDVEAVIITHQHLDHVGDLHVMIAQAVWFKNKFKKKLKIFAPKGTAEKIYEMNKLFYASKEEQNFELIKNSIDFVDLCDGFEFDVGEYHAKTFAMVHENFDCFGFTFSDKSGKVVGFSADTEDCKNLHEILKFSNFAFVEMSRLKKGKYHLSVNEFIDLTKKYQNCKMFPVHTTDETQQLAVENGLNFLVDNQVLEL